ncbi:uncharacterized protein LOC143277670 [Babylonia areolata]|uniref:uncharacterized protein LOC143277670 n=1 Tax=Babylonia areolata TaxID=304850 RepID=UPI003FD44590
MYQRPQSPQHCNGGQQETVEQEDGREMPEAELAASDGCCYRRDTSSISALQSRGLQSAVTVKQEPTDCDAGTEQQHCYHKGKKNGCGSIEAIRSVSMCEMQRGNSRMGCKRWLEDAGSSVVLHCGGRRGHSGKDVNAPVTWAVHQRERKTCTLTTKAEVEQAQSTSLPHTDIGRREDRAIKEDCAKEDHATDTWRKDCAIKEDHATHTWIKEDRTKEDHATHTWRKEDCAKAWCTCRRHISVKEMPGTDRDRLEPHTHWPSEDGAGTLQTSLIPAVSDRERLGLCLEVPPRPGMDSEQRSVRREDGKKDVSGCVLWVHARHEECVHIKQEPEDDYPPSSPHHTVRHHRDVKATPTHAVNTDQDTVTVLVKQEADVRGDHYSKTCQHSFGDRCVGCTYPAYCSSQSCTNPDYQSTQSCSYPDYLSTRMFCSGKNPERSPTTVKSASQLRHNINNTDIHFVTASKRTKSEDESKTGGTAPASSADIEEKADECSDESDCETLPIHFETAEEPVEGERLYECGMCHISFPLPALLHEHVSQHNATDRSYDCSLCKTSFLHISRLTQHTPLHTFSEGIQLQYDNPKSFVCHVCLKVFSRLYELNRHQKIHSGSKPFVCGVCRKTFSRGDELSRHVKVHSGVKPFACDQCTRAFITKHELTQHKKSHSESKPFVCAVCSRGFVRADRLVHHQHVHAGERPFECEVCCKRFITPSEVRQHQKIHSGLKPFVCEVCCKAYLKVNDLNRHMNMHTGQKPFACDICGKAFHRRDILSRHKKIHSRDKRGQRGRPVCNAAGPVT